MVVRSQTTRPKLAELRDHLHKLEQSRRQSEEVVQLRVKVNNVKSVLTLLSQMPNVTRMRIKELRNLDLPVRLKQLGCYGGLDNFIKQQVDGENERQISDLKSMLEVFDEKKYRQLLVRFY